MRELLEFPDDKAYYAAQRRTRNRRDRLLTKRRARKRAYFLPRHISQIWEYTEDHMILVDKILCHGARCGGEVRALQDKFPQSAVVGTDLFPDGDGVIQWDFRKYRKEWLGKFDLIYSNSLDHSDRPEDTLRVWLNQLTDAGRLFLEWTVWHAHRPKHGDCFCADFHEYVTLLESVGHVYDLIYARPCRILIVGGR